MLKYNYGVSPNFTAIQRAVYECKNTDNVTKNVTVCEIEPRDLPYLERFSDTFEMVEDKDPIRTETRQEDIDYAISNMKMICKKKKQGDERFDKTRMFMAFDEDKKSCGVIISGMPKENLDIDKKVHYSGRKDSSETETEIDWFATWTRKGAKKLRGIGKALCTEVFKSAKEDGFGNIFVQSDIPEYSDAHNIYPRFGFMDVDKRQTIGNVMNFRRIGANDESIFDVEIIPMLIDTKTRDINAEKMSKCQNRQEGDRKSFGLDTYV